MAKKNKIERRYIDDLVNEVNNLDKNIGIKLKKPDIFSEPDNYYQISLMRSELYLSKIITILNGIDPDDWFTSSDGYGTVSGPTEINQYEFTSISNLDWEKNNVYNTTSILFKCRFLTTYINNIKSRLGKVNKNRYKTDKRKFGIDEYSYFYLKNQINDIRSLVIIMMNDKKDYSNILLKNLFNSHYGKKKIKQKKLNTQIFAAVKELREGMTSNVLSEAFMEDDMIIYTIMRLAYMISTNDTHLSYLPNFKYFEGATRKDDLVNLIEELGHQIITTSEYTKRPMMYESFFSASPLIMTNYTNVNNNVSLSVGVRALAYVDFIMNDKKIHKFIECMINK